jgi:HlyD family secretion protein
VGTAAPDDFIAGNVTLARATSRGKRWFPVAGGLGEGRVQGCDLPAGAVDYFKENVMRRVLVVVGVLVVAAVVVWRVTASGSKETAGWRLVEATRGDLEVTVSCTGILEPVTTVQVGTQVSGIVAAIGADFNDHVTAGQVIARIDTTLLSSAVRDAAAGLQRAHAELGHAQTELARTVSLHNEQLVSDTELATAEYTRNVAEANLRSAEVSRDRARQNLAYATITSPIAGTVIARSVEVGQTVQSSFSAPELFKIAGDLTKMRILASVDESDIGAIAPGQTVRFTVQAYPDASFAGVVDQVRLQSTTQENVVNYTVVIAVDNPDGRLLPGMTATIDILVDTARDVLAVPNAALRFKADDAMVAAMRARRQAEKGSGGEGGGTGGAHAAGGGDRPRDVTLLWYLDAAGEPAAMPVKTGLSNGNSTAVTPLGDRTLAPGTQIIVGKATGGTTATTTATSATTKVNPLQPQSAPRRGPGGPPGGF